MEEKSFQFVITKSDQNQRIDAVLANVYPEYTRSFFQKLIKENYILVNDKVIKSNYKCKEQDNVHVIIPAPKETEIVPENIPLDIIYEDNDIIIVNKPKGMVVHPSAGHYTGTLVNALLYHCKDQLSGINGELRPGIVHRIDMDTTGLLVVCKNDKAHQCIAQQLKVHSITRRYYAIVMDNINEDTGCIDAPIGRHPVDRKKMAINYKNGKEAITHFKVLERFGKYTLIQCELETGRTHQIRVHMSSIHHPLLGDQIYGSTKQPYSLQGQCLHAKVLGFIHPTTQKYIEFDSELPDYFNKLLHRFREGKF